MIRTCSFCLFFGESDSARFCPRCGRENLRDATEWEMFMGRRLSQDEEWAVRERVRELLRREAHE